MHGSSIRSSWRQRIGFVAVSGAGWLLDTSGFMASSGPGGWGGTPANMVGGVCGTLLMFAPTARAILRPNGGAVLQKLLVLLPFNLVVITANAVVLGALAHASAGWAAGWAIPPDEVRFAAKVLVTPFTLALNFVVVRPAGALHRRPVGLIFAKRSIAFLSGIRGSHQPCQAGSCRSPGR